MEEASERSGRKKRKSKARMSEQEGRSARSRLETQREEFLCIYH